MASVNCVKKGNILSLSWGTFTSRFLHNGKLIFRGNKTKLSYIEVYVGKPYHFESFKATSSIVIGFHTSRTVIPVKV